jgi:hypothetical protein
LTLDVANQTGGFMSEENNKSIPVQRWLIGGATAALLMGGAVVQHGAVTATTERQTKEEHRGFYCNAKALNPEERARHQKLTEKLLALRNATAEVDKGYELQFQPRDVSLAELAEWVVMESRCCPFFDFHIDLEQEGALVCLRLTGKEGVKHFIQAKFGLDAK